MWRWTGYTSYLACVFNMVSFWSGKPSKECESCRWERSTCVVSTIFFTLKKKTNSMQVKMLVIWTRNEINQGDEIRSPVLKRVDKWTIVRKLGMFILRRCPVLFSLVELYFTDVRLIHWDTTLYRAHLSFVPGIQKSLTFFLHSFRLEWLSVNGHFFSCPRDSRRTVRLTNTETLSIVCQKVFLNVKYLQMHDSMSMSLLRLSGYVTMNRVYKLSGVRF